MGMVELQQAMDKADGINNAFVAKSGKQNMSIMKQLI